MALSELPGVKQVVADLERDIFTVSYDETLVATSKMFESIERLGFSPRILESELPQKRNPRPDALPAEVEALINADTAIVIYYGAPWCGACKIMERSTFVDDEIKVSLKAMQFLKIDVDENAAMADAYAISAVPTLIVLSPTGDEVYRHVGPLSASETLLVLAQFSDGLL